MNRKDLGDEPLSLTDEAAQELPEYDIGGENVGLDLAVQEQLGKVFRAYCDDLIHQPIPDKFAVLLAKLEAKQREKK